VELFAVHVFFEWNFLQFTCPGISLKSVPQLASMPVHFACMLGPGTRTHSYQPAHFSAAWAYPFVNTESDEPSRFHLGCKCKSNEFGPTHLSRQLASPADPVPAVADPPQPAAASIAFDSSNSISSWRYLCWECCDPWGPRLAALSSWL
jgi:hypothetical protein